jgi:nitroreductase
VRNGPFYNRVMSLDLATVDALLTTTRAVRKRLDLDRPVPRDVILECLRLAVQAPSAADTQIWRSVVVTDEVQRKKIADVRRSVDEAYVRGEIERLEDGPERRRFVSALYLLEHLHEVPALVLAYAVAPELRGLEGAELPPALVYGSIFPAVWSFQLALRSRGLGSTPLFAPEEESIADVVGAPPDAQLVTLLPVAYFTGSTFQPARRRPVEEVTFWDTWGQSDVPA